VLLTRSALRTFYRWRKRCTLHRPRGDVRSAWPVGFENRLARSAESLSELPRSGLGRGQVRDCRSLACTSGRVASESDGRCSGRAAAVVTRPAGPCGAAAAGRGHFGLTPGAGTRPVTSSPMVRVRFWPAARPPGGRLKLGPAASDCRSGRVTDAVGPALCFRIRCVRVSRAMLWPGRGRARLHGSLLQGRGHCPGPPRTDSRPRAPALRFDGPVCRPEPIGPSAGGFVPSHSAFGRLRAGPPPGGRLGLSPADAHGRLRVARAGSAAQGSGPRPALLVPPAAAVSSPRLTGRQFPRSVPARPTGRQSPGSVPHGS